MTRAGAALTLAAGVLLACASDADQPAVPEAQAAAEEMIAVTGRVVATGSDPFVILIIVSDANEQFELVGEQADPLWDLQQRKVTVSGRIVQQAAGPGFPAQLRVDSYTLARPAG